MPELNDTLIGAPADSALPATIREPIRGEPATPPVGNVVHRPRGSRHGVGPITDWERRYRSTVIAADVTVIVAGVAASAVALTMLDGSLTAAAFAIPVAAALVAAIGSRRAWQASALGQGVEEYRRLGIGLFTGAVVVAMLGALLDDVDARPWVYVVTPALGATMLTGRYLLRRGLHHARRQGRCMLPVVAAGSTDSVRDLIARCRDDSHVGWHVQAACIVDQPNAEGEIDGVPVVGGLDTLADTARRGGYRIVAVTPDAYWTASTLRNLAWDLEGTSAELVVAPVLMDVGRPRLRVSGVLGMPMLQLSQPTFTGWQRLVKEAIDRVSAAGLLVLFSPVLVTIALAVKLSGRGPVFYCQRRVMRDGESFRMWKFRTMRVGADRERQAIAQDDEGAGPLFKMRRDPRVTKVGRILRRYSLDELPQLFNVLCGQMSLVGPRPPLPEESRTYDPDVGRRLLVKPGMTGLWQVSGRSDLSWEESVRLDLRYVEEWSLTLDAMILWKTARAVLAGKGAY